MKLFLILTSIAILLTVLLIFLGGFLGGACHCMAPITVFFPYGTIVVMHTTWRSFGFLLAILQFPLYAVIVASLKGNRQRTLALLVLVLAHTAASLLGLTVYR
jgi:hypothetical protein